MKRTKYIKPEICIHSFACESITAMLSARQINGSYAASALAGYTLSNAAGDNQQVTTLKNIFELKY
ncbi:MAG: hypothetical protein SOS24_00710 [Clostridia bacterium]|nr:hypothetical protein [Clostridia bacterium]